ncbi:MAG: hypothetical protein LBG45_02755 [Dysgonamonadaceae bacterium]|jgi:hypothetical protein|nr:hypothetical protein [Dysgonamonadaceae bacterium]
MSNKKGTKAAAGQLAAAALEKQATDTAVKMPEQEGVRVAVLRPFADRYDGKTQYSPGDTPVFDAERAGDLIRRGLAELRIEE